MKIPFLRLGEGLKTLSQFDIKQYRDQEIDTILITRNIQKIEKGAFHQFKKIKKVIFEAYSECKEIQEHAFSQCFSLQQVILPLSLEIIGRRAFAFCLSLTQIAFSVNVNLISQEAFYYCISLPKVYIENSYVSVQKNAFEGCYQVKEFYIGSDKYLTRQIHDRLALYKNTHNFQDKIFCRAVDVDEINQGNITGTKLYFIWTRIGLYQGYGKNLHEALDEYNFEVGHKQLTREIGELTPDSEINMSQYRLLTKDCKAGTEEFLISKNIPLDATMKISDVYALSEGYGRSYLLEKIMKKGSKKNGQDT